MKIIRNEITRMLYNSGKTLVDVPDIEIGQVELNAKCHLCNKTTALKVQFDDLNNYLGGDESVERIFPYLNKGLRELLISGTCTECWDRKIRIAEDEDF